MAATLDQLASLARTALDDRYGLPADEFEKAEGRAVAPGSDPFKRYALDRLDEIIETINPSTQTREAFARSLRALGLCIAERADDMRVPSEDDPEPHASAYREARGALDTALDYIDSAIRSLEEVAAMREP